MPTTEFSTQFAVALSYQSREKQVPNCELVVPSTDQLLVFVQCIACRGVSTGGVPLAHVFFMRKADIHVTNSCYSW